MIDETSDIVRRLRAGPSWTGNSGWSLCREAADEIERLRIQDAQLRDALQGIIDWSREGCPDGGTYALLEARAALANIALVKPLT